MIANVLKGFLKHEDNGSTLCVSILIPVALSTIDALTSWEQFKRRPSSLAVSRLLCFLIF